MNENIHFLRVGTLEEGERLPPDAHYFVSRKHPWIAVPDDVPAYDTLPTNEGGPELSPEAQMRIARALRT